MAHLAISIDWFGPYESIEEVKEVLDDFGEGVYLALGCVGAQRKPRIQYIGYGAEVASRVSRDHSKLNMISNKFQIWMGEISSTGKPGRKSFSKASANVHTAEGILIYGLKPPLNTQRKKKPPQDDVTILNRWWACDYETPFAERPIDNWPDIIDYRGGFPARLGMTDWEDIE